MCVLRLQERGEKIWRNKSNEQKKLRTHKKKDMPKKKRDDGS